MLPKIKIGLDIIENRKQFLTTFNEENKEDYRLSDLINQNKEILLNNTDNEEDTLQLQKQSSNISAHKQNKDNVSSKNKTDSTSQPDKDYYRLSDLLNKKTLLNNTYHEKYSSQLQKQSYNISPQKLLDNMDFGEDLSNHKELLEPLEPRKLMSLERLMELNPHLTKYKPEVFKPLK